MAYLIFSLILAALASYLCYDRYEPMVQKVLNFTLIPFGVFMLSMLFSMFFGLSIQKKFTNSDIWTTTNTDTIYISKHGDSYLTTDYINGEKYYLYLDSTNTLKKVSEKTFKSIAVHYNNSVNPMRIETTYKTDRWYVEWFGMYDFMVKTVFVIPENTLNKVK